MADALLAESPLFGGTSMVLVELTDRGWRAWVLGGSSVVMAESDLPNAGRDEMHVALDVLHDKLDDMLAAKEADHSKRLDLLLAARGRKRPVPIVGGMDIANCMFCQHGIAHEHQQTVLPPEWRKAHEPSKETP